MTYTLIPGQPHTASEEETMSMIRSVLTEDAPVEPVKKPRAKSAPVSEQVHSVTTDAAILSRVQEAAPRRRAADFPELSAADVEPVSRKQKTGKPRATSAVTGLLSRVRSFRPSTRHLAIVSTLLLIVVRPHWFVVGAVLGLAAVIGAFMFLGADRIWGGILGRLNRIEATNPQRAAMLRTKLDRFAYRWDGFLDLFPDGMVDGLYMPDFQAMGQADERHTDAMIERLSRMGQEG